MRQSGFEERTNEYTQYLLDLTERVFKKRPFDVLCAVLRVGFVQGEAWDAFEESVEAFDDFNLLLQSAIDQRPGKCAYRVALLMYCQAVEMTAPNEMLVNLLRTLCNQPYLVRPFRKFMKLKNKKPLSAIPPSATVKFREIKRLASEAGETMLREYIDEFFDDQIRNAFSHSDYVLSDRYFRWTESGLPQQMEMEELAEIITNRFAFYSALLPLRKSWLKRLARLPRYHKWPRYEVLELLSDGELGVYGFNVHFSNGSKAVLFGSLYRTGIPEYLTCATGFSSNPSLR